MAGRLSIYRPVPADPRDLFTEEEIEKSRSYTRPLRRLGLASQITGMIWITAFIWTQAGPWLLERWGIEAWPLQLLVLNTAMVLISTLMGMPFSLYRTFVHEEKWGFNTETPKIWATDQVKSLLLGFAISAAIFIPLWWVIRSTELWWVFGALVLTAFGVVLAAIYPIVLLPIFNKLTPVEDAELRTHLGELARGAGVNVSDVQQMDAGKRTRHNNAFFAGLGKTRRLVIFDNMVDWERKLIDSVVGHEIGHWRNHHIFKGGLLGTVTTFLTFAALRLLFEWDRALVWAGVDGAGDPASLPLFILGFGLIGIPISLIDSWQSRAYERQADLFSLDLTRDADAYERVWRQFTEKDLPDLDPSWWRRINGSHPPIAERLQFGRRWAAFQSDV